MPGRREEHCSSDGSIASSLPASAHPIVLPPSPFPSFLPWWLQKTSWRPFLFLFLSWWSCPHSQNSTPQHLYPNITKSVDSSKILGGGKEERDLFPRSRNSSHFFLGLLSVLSTGISLSYKSGRPRWGWVWWFQLGFQSWHGWDCSHWQWGTPEEFSAGSFWNDSGCRHA